jgi:hypothetical protein
MDTKDSFYKPSGVNSFAFEREGYMLSGYYEYEEGFDGDNIDPPYDDVYTVTEVFINNSKSNAYDLIDPSVIQSIERELAR